MADYDDAVGDLLHFVEQMRAEQDGATGIDYPRYLPNPGVRQAILSPYIAENLLWFHTLSVCPPLTTDRKSVV